MLRKLSLVHTYCRASLKWSVISKFKFCALIISISLLWKLLTNSACSQTQFVETHPSGKKALIILSPSGLMASSGIRWKSSRLSKARTQQVSLKLKTEAASKEFTVKYPWNSISAARRLVTLKMQLSILCFLYD